MTAGNRSDICLLASRNAIAGNFAFFRRHKVFTVHLFFLAALAVSSISSAQSLGIALITDGNRGIIQQYQTLVKHELNDLLADDFELKIYSGREFSVDYQYQNVGKVVQKAYRDDRIDIVISIGVITTHWMLQQREFPKPTIGALTLFPKAQNAPRQGNSSGITNFVYISQTVDFEQDVKTFREIIPFKRLGLMVDEAITRLPEMEVVKQQILAAGKNLGYQTEFIPVGSEQSIAFSLLEQKANALDAVIMLPLTRWSANEISQLAEKLVELKLPSYSVLGRADVNRGVLLASAPSSDSKRIARRLALNARDIILGSEAAALEIPFTSQSDLSLNETTARAIGLPLSWNLLNRVNVVAGEEETGEKLDLISAVEEAVKQNVSLKATAYDVLRKKEDFWAAKSQLLPSASVSSTWVKIDEDRANLPGQNEKELSGKLEVNQVIFDVRAWSNIFIQRDLLKGSAHDRWEVQLDTVLEVTKAYLNLLSAERLVQIEVDNIDLIKANLKQAINRVSTGTSNKSEEYRWQSELAKNEQRVLDAFQQKNMARVQLNNILNRSLDAELSVEDIGEEHDIFVFNQKIIDGYVDTIDKLDQFKAFIVNIAVERSPEIKSIDATISAADAALKSSKYLFLLPTVGLQLGYEKQLSASGGSSDTGGGADLNNEESTIALNISLPLDSNLAMHSEVKSSSFRLNQLRLQRAELVKGIEQRMLNALFAIRASFPGIGLARDSAEAARKNLKIISDAYARGTVSIVDLLDAQNASLVADQTAANAVYDYLQDLMILQRAMGGFVFLSDQESKDEFIRRLQTFYDQY